MKILKFRSAEEAARNAEDTAEDTKGPTRGSGDSQGGDSNSGKGSNRQTSTNAGGDTGGDVTNRRSDTRSNAASDDDAAADSEHRQERTDRGSQQVDKLKTPGSRLKAARERLNWTITDVAGELNLSRDIISAIEEEDYSLLPEKTYVQGYLKSYARLVDVSETDVIGASVNPSLNEADVKAIKPARSLPEPKRPGSGLGVMLLGLVGLMIAAAVWMGYQQEWFSMSADKKVVDDTVRLGPGTTVTDNTITAAKEVTPIAPGSEQSVSFGKRTTVEVVPKSSTDSVSDSASSVATTAEESAQTVVVASDTSSAESDVSTSGSSSASYRPEVVVIPPTAGAAVATPSDADGGEVVETIIETITVSPTGEEIKTVEIIAGDGTSSVTTSGSDAAVASAPAASSSSDSSASDVSSTAPEVTSGSTEEVVNETTEAPADSATASSNESTDADEDTYIDADGSEDSTSTTEPAVSAVTSGGDWPELVLTGSGDSWVEIVDASGTKVFVEMVKENQSYNVQGEPPLSLLIGNAPAVSIKYDGKDVDPNDSANSSNVARFTLGE